MTSSLSLAELNRTLLARQNLLRRDGGGAADVIKRSLGLQAQGNEPPFVALWSRLAGFSKDHLDSLLEARSVVRATTARSTLHIVDASDFLQLWPLVQPASQRTFRSNYREIFDTIDTGLLAEMSASFLSVTPRSFPELRDHLAGSFPGVPGGALSWAARANLPLVQVPPAGSWGDHSSPRYSLAEEWLGRPVHRSEAAAESIVRRYLESYGPASRADLTAWAGVSLSDALNALKGELIELKDDAGQVLYDVPEGVIERAETPAPVRFLHSWDNVLLAHKSRERIISPAVYRKVFLTVGRVRPTVLIDGFVSAAWEWSKERSGLPTLTIAPFIELTKAQEEEIQQEGAELLRFLSGEETAGDISINPVEATDE